MGEGVANVMDGNQGVQTGEATLQSKKAALLEKLRAKKTAPEVPAPVAVPAAEKSVPSEEETIVREEVEIESQKPEDPFVALAMELGLVEGGAPGKNFFNWGGMYPSEEQIKFLDSQQQEISRLFLLLRNGKRELAQGQKPKAVDMEVVIKASSDGMEAWGLLLPPLFGGNELDEDQVKKKLRVQQINYGVDLAPLFQGIEQKAWLKLFVVAKGLPAENGTDGEVRDHFSREKKISIMENESHTVDYKNLHWVQKIAAGEVICDLIQPTDAKDGFSVLGVKVKKRPGRMPKVPAGTNTQVNEEKTALVSLCDGQLTFVGGLFRVDQVLKVKGDVDNSVGNLDVVGDLDIGGNVGDGYSLKATGNIVIRGLVEGAFLESGGNIQVILGMKGNGKGKLDAKGNVVCKYLENATVSAGKNVVADSIINSSVASGDTITATSGHGVIIGGKLMARNKIEAKIIGNDSNRTTDLTVGADPALLDTILLLKKELGIKKRKIEETELNIAYLEKQENLEKTYQDLLSQLKLRLSVEKMTYEKKVKQLQTHEEQLDDVGCQVLASTMFPHTTVEIGGQKLIVQTMYKMCRVYKDKGEITIGTK